MGIEQQEAPEATLRAVLANQRSCDAGEAAELRHLWSKKGQQFWKIGAGACGEVYQMTGPGQSRECTVAKRAKTEEYARQLRGDYEWHLRIDEAFARCAETLQLDVCLPQPRDLVEPSNVDEHGARWWRDNGSKFPASAETLPEVVLLAERLMPVPREVRHSLITLYCPENRQEAARNDPRNLDCLIRLYLGKERPERRLRSTVSIFGLRNYQLYINDLEKIDLDTETYAVQMARALALMHWEVKCDVNDVEFVLGGAREDAADRAVELWLIDFNRVRAVSMDSEGIDVATEAFMVNDRYYPRPLGETAASKKLWTAFEEAYLEASRRLRRAQEASGKAVDWAGLPEAFIRAVEEAQGKLLREKADAMGRAA